MSCLCCQVSKFKALVVRVVSSINKKIRSKITFLCTINIKGEEYGRKHHKNKKDGTKRSSKATTHAQLVSNASKDALLIQKVIFCDIALIF